MRVLLVGASGAIGRRLISQLAEHGDQVTGTSRSAAKAGQLRSLGAEPAVLDVLDAGAVRAVIGNARPDAIVYQATARSRPRCSSNRSTSQASVILSSRTAVTFPPDRVSVTVTRESGPV